MAKNLPLLSSQVSVAQPFGLPTTARPTGKGRVTLYANKCAGKIERSAISSGLNIVDSWKVLISLGYGEGGEARQYPRMIMGKPIIAPPPSSCTMTYLVAGTFQSESEACNFADYLCTRFLRFLVGLRKNTQHVTRDRFSFAPILSMKQKWSDEKLYKHFGLTKDEIAFIESMIKPMQKDNE